MFLVGLTGTVAGVLDGGVNVSVMLGVEGADEALVQLVGTKSHGEVEPEKEGTLQQPVEGEVVGDGITEKLDHVEESKDHPVGQPLSVIVLGDGFDGADGNVGWVQEADEVAEESGKVAEEKVEGVDGDNT